MRAKKTGRSDDGLRIGIGQAMRMKAIAQQLMTKRQELRSAPIGEQAEEADADEAAGQYMQ